MLLGLHETARGERLEEFRSEVTELVGDRTETDDLFSLHMANGDTALVAGDLEKAFASAMEAAALQSQNPEVPLALALRVSIWTHDLHSARQVAARIADIPLSGAYGQASRIWASAAVAALEGRKADALAGFRDARARLQALQQSFDAALSVVDATVLLPDEPEVQGWAAEARILLEELRAKPYLAKLDEALASVQKPSTSALAESRAESPTG